MSLIRSGPGYYVFSDRGEILGWVQRRGDYGWTVERRTGQTQYALWGWGFHRRRDAVAWFEHELELERAEGAAGD